MYAFAQLYSKLDQTNKTNQKLSILADFFNEASSEDKIWVLYFLTGGKIGKHVNSSQLKSWAQQESNIPEWLFKESYTIVGDSSETIARILPSPNPKLNAKVKSGELDTKYWVNFLQSMKDKSIAERHQMMQLAWSQLDEEERFMLHKLLARSFRIGVSRLTVANALEKVSPLDKATILHRLSGNWHPDDIGFEELIMTETSNDNISQPYPFALAYQLSDEMTSGKLGGEDEWQAEWKWDGIRAQIIIRDHEIFIWTRGEELVTERFPELHKLVDIFPQGTVIDGEIVVITDGQLQSFNSLQPRVGRKKPDPKDLTKHPVQIILYDLLEFNGQDIRQRDQQARRQLLEQLFTNHTQDLHGIASISELINFSSWEELAQIRETSRTKQAEGIMLKKLDSKYHVGRKKGEWYKWKVDPFTLDCVLIYAQRGSGRRANLYTDYTFALRDDEGNLVPITKAYSGLTDVEITELDNWIRKNTVEQFGPVRSVKPELVFEIAFEGIQESSRHKSGLAVRFPRILRQRQDKTISEADDVAAAKRLLAIYEAANEAT